VAHPVPTKEAMTTESLRYNCFISNGGNAISNHACPEAKGSSPTAGLALLWDRSPLRGNSDYWQISQEEAGRIIFAKWRHKCIMYIKEMDKYTRRDVADTKRNNNNIFNSRVDKGKFFSCLRYEGRWEGGV